MEEGMDGWTVGRTDGRNDQWTDGWTDTTRTEKRRVMLYETALVLIDVRPH